MSDKINDIKEKIIDEIPFVDIKPYSHNIISLNLGMLGDNGMSDKEVKDFMKENGLDELGWDCDFRGEWKSSECSPPKGSKKPTKDEEEKRRVAWEGVAYLQSIGFELHHLTK